MYERSAASASSSSVPAKQEPGSINANSVRDETSMRAIDVDADEFIAQRVGFDDTLQRRQRNTFGALRARTASCQFQCTFAHLLHKHGRFGDCIDQAPLPGLLAAHALGRSAKNVRE